MIAFFCAEYGIEDSLPLYAGGLGILAGDFLFEAGDMKVPFVAVGLFYNGGFARDRDFEGDREQELKHTGFQKVRTEKNQPLIIEINIENRTVGAQVWTHTYGSARLYLLDTDVEMNAPQDRKITHRLYDPDTGTRILQELVLGVGGVKLLRTLGIVPDIYHLNEGHTSFVALALAAEYLLDNPQESSFTAALQQMRSKIVATKHTILSGAGIFLQREQFKKIIHEYFEHHRIDFDEFFSLGNDKQDPDTFSATRFLLKSSIRSNGVSMLHTIFEKHKHQNSPLIPITNGVYAKRWRSSHWPEEGQSVLTDGDIWSIRNTLRKELLDHVKKLTKVELNPEALTIVWARRITAYKRPHLLFSDLARLAKIVAHAKMPVQFIVAGIAHEADKEGMAMAEKIKAHTNDPSLQGKVVYLPRYSIDDAKKLVGGADVWLNTPTRGVEACGTSGMKSALNGGLQCSVSDGWFEEVDWQDMGWVLPDENTDAALYETIENVIAPLYFKRNAENIPEGWIKQIRSTTHTIKERFTATRMIHEYLRKLYMME